MRTSETTAALFKAFIAAHAELTNPKKTATANAGSFGYSYAPLDELIEADRAILAKNGLAVIQSLGSVENDGVLFASVTSRLVHTSGEWMETEPFMLPGGNSQELGSAASYGRRYQRNALLDIQPSGEDDDGAKASEGKVYGGGKPSVPTDLTPENAASVKLTFGKHKGLTLAEVDVTDHGYVEWLGRESKDADLRRAAQMVAAPVSATEPFDPADPGPEIPF